MNLQPGQFGANPFLAAGGMLASGGGSNWFARRTATRHRYNQQVIAAHLKDKKTPDKATSIRDIPGLVTSAGTSGWLSRRAGLQTMLDDYHVDAMFQKKPKPAKPGKTPPIPPIRPPGFPSAPATPWSATPAGPAAPTPLWTPPQVVRNPRPRP